VILPEPTPERIGAVAVMVALLVVKLSIEELENSLALLEL
jgi:hypothetical protein